MDLQGGYQQKVKGKIEERDNGNVNEERNRG